MSVPAVDLTNSQEQQLDRIDLELGEATREFEELLRHRTPNGPVTAGMTADDRARYEAVRQAVRDLSEEREALRARLFAERTEELRRQHVAGMVADQELGRAAARAATEHTPAGGGLAGMLRRLIPRR